MDNSGQLVQGCQLVQLCGTLHSEDVDRILRSLEISLLV